MTNLTIEQTKQAQDLIEKYGFCSLETQKELVKAGFFEKVKVNFCLNMTKFATVEMTKYNGIADEIPMPQMHEVWKALPKSIKDKFDNNCYKVLSSNYVYYTEHDCAVQYSGNANKNNDVNETEAMCQLWLKLHKEGLL